MTVQVNDDCISCGTCESIAPDVFEMDDIAVVKAGFDESANAELIDEAIASCPVSAITK